MKRYQKSQSAILPADAQSPPDLRLRPLHLAGKVPGRFVPQQDRRLQIPGSPDSIHAPPPAWRADDEPDPARLRPTPIGPATRSEEHTSELQSRFDLVCRLLLEKKNN